MVLIMSKDLGNQGGVVSFVSMLLPRLDAKLSPVHFRIGAPMGRETHSVLKVLYPVWDSVRLMFTVLMKRVDCVHINPSLNARSLLRDGLFLLVLKMIGYRNTLIFIHGWEDACEQRLNSSPILRKLFRSQFGGAKQIVVLASRFKQALEAMKIEGSRIRVMTTMFDGDQFRGVVGNRNNDAPSLLFLSRFVREKGVYEVLGAMPEILRCHPKTRLIMAGDGPEAATLKKWAADHRLQQSVSFPGYLRGKEKYQVLLHSDIFVFPTYYGEGCPVALLEAMAAGLPIVTAPAGGIPDFFKDGENGTLLSEITSQSVAQAVISLLDDPEKMKKVRESNRNKAWAEYEADVVSAKIADLYGQLAER